MNYELAKQLKDAGFPVTYDYGRKFYGNPDREVTEEEKIYIPTLSELIEACKKELEEIVIYVTIDFVEVKGANPIYGWDLNVKGSTPEEAVAKLWLELNKGLTPESNEN